MKQGLARQQALDYKNDKPVGEFIRVESLPFSFLSAFAMGSAVVLVAFAFWGEYTRKSYVSGYLSPSMGLVNVYAPQDGTLIEKHVSEGQAVKAGDTVFVLSTDSSARDTPQAQAAVVAHWKQRRESLETELLKHEEIHQVQYRSLFGRLQGLQSKLQLVSSEIETQQHLAGAAARSKRSQRLLSSKELLNLQALQRIQVGLQHDIQTAQLELEASQLKLKNQRAAIKGHISALTHNITETESLHTVAITAPQDGTVKKILAEQGQNASPSNPLLSILPAGATLQAHLLLPSSAVGFVELGQTVFLRYQAFPYQRFGSHQGRVVEIAKARNAAKEADLPLSLQEPAYRVTVEIDQQTVQAYRQEIPLQAGMLLDAEICLDRRRLIEWIFDPLTSVGGRV